jgi:DNA replication and repair protein RecF
VKLDHLSLINFKNHRSFEMDGTEDVIGIFGLNGLGKTNVLDAIHFVCLGKSYFSGTDVQCIEHSEADAGIRAMIGDDEIKIRFKRGGRKSISKNDVATKRVDFIGNNFAVIIAPGDIELVYGSNSVKRQFVDQLLSQTDRDYLGNLVVYTRLLEQRNRHLKGEVIDEALLTTFDEQMMHPAEIIYTKRQHFFTHFSKVYQQQYKLLSKEKETVGITYSSQLSEGNYLDAVKGYRAKDMVLQRSSYGIHKDEIELTLDDKILKKFGSQGQIKSSLIAIKLAEYAHISVMQERKPFLLLDDIFEKIDNERAKELTQIIKKGNFGQIFITDTSEERIKAFCEQISKSYQLIELK